jgi:hypothetical protein
VRFSVTGSGKSVAYRLLGTWVDSAHKAPCVRVCLAHIGARGRPHGRASRPVGVIAAAVMNRRSDVPPDINARPAVATPLVVKVVSLCLLMVAHESANPNPKKSVPMSRNISINDATTTPVLCVRHND